MKRGRSDEAFIHQHQQGVWLFLRMLGASPDLADDLTQEVFLVALGKRWWRIARAEQLTWLRAIARNIWRGHIS